MSAAAVLVIVIAAGEARAPTTQALLTTATAALPPETTVRVVPVPDASEADLARIGRELGAGAVVAVSWRPAPAGPRASLRLHVARGDRWTVRAIDFSPVDSATERGRTLGFAIASMWPESVAGTASAGRPPPTTAPAPPPEPAKEATAPRERAEPASTAPPPAAASPGPAAVGRDVAPLPPPASRAVGIGVVGSTGLGGSAAGLGGNVEIAWRGFESVWLRAALALRVGAVPDLPGDDWLGSLGVGGEWWPGALALGQRWRLGVRADLLGLGHVVHRAASAAASDPQQPGAPAAPIAPETLVRVLPGLDASIRSTVRVSPRLDLTFGVGLELAAGRTDLRVGDDRMTRATLAPARGIAELGLRLSF